MKNKHLIEVLVERTIWVEIEVEREEDEEPTDLDGAERKRAIDEASQQFASDWEECLAVVREAPDLRPAKESETT